MKCPNCGQWNKASLPRCYKCGTALPKQPDYMRAKAPEWQYDINEKGDDVYIHVTEEGAAEYVSDSRDTLAREMVELEKRKQRGERQQRRLREESVKRGYAPSSRTLRKNTTRGTFFTVEDDPSATLRPMPSELVEGGEVAKDAMHAYTVEYQRDALADLEAATPTPELRRAPQLPPNTRNNPESRQVYDGFNDTYAYEPLWQEAQRKNNYSNTNHYTGKQIVPKRVSRGRWLRIAFLVVLVAVVAMGGYLGISVLIENNRKNAVENKPTVVASTYDDQRAHTITIPGKDGDRIYIRERQSTYTVTDGKAVIPIPDYVWFENKDVFLQETMDVVLTPYLKTGDGQLKPLEPIEYQIDIPASRIDLITPSTSRIELVKSIYTIRISVDPESQIFANGEDISASYNATNGEVVYNATVNPVGENIVEFKVRTRYHRENTLTVVLYRRPMEVRIDLPEVLPERTTIRALEIKATTVPGADITILKPEGASDLNITNLNSDGTFTFITNFDHFGYNTIAIQASYGGKVDVLEFEIYFVDNVPTYTAKAWAMRESDYNNLINNNENLVKRSQVYKCDGYFTEFIENATVQTGYFNAGTEESPLVLRIENGTQTVWKLDTTYELWADAAYGMYGDIPQMIARYTYQR